MYFMDWNLVDEMDGIDEDILGGWVAGGGGAIILLYVGK